MSHRSNNECPGDDAWDDELLIQEYNRSVRLVDQRIDEMESGKLLGSTTTTQIPASNGDSDGGNGTIKVSDLKKDKRRNKKKSDSNELLWKEGDNCIAIFKEDGIEYEAKIVSIDHKYGCCVVKYLGYDNEELQYLQDLKPTRGLQSQLDQMELFSTDEIIENVQVNLNENCELEDDDELILGNQSVNPTRPEFIMPEIPSHVGQEKQPPNKPEFVLPSPPTFLTNSLNEPLSKKNDALASMLMSWYMCGYQTGYYTALKQMKVKE